jgi:hypothetical protein
MSGRTGTVAEAAVASLVHQVSTRKLPPGQQLLGRRRDLLAFGALPPGDDLLMISEKETRRSLRILIQSIAGRIVRRRGWAFETQCRDERRQPTSATSIVSNERQKTATPQAEFGVSPEIACARAQLFRPDFLTNQPMNIPHRTPPLAVLRRELAPVRFERLKVSLGFVASFALLTATLLPASGQSAGEYKQPDYSQFKVEDGQITLEFWSWVGGLDQVVKEFEKDHPNITVHVNNIGAGPTEYTKLQTALKAGSGAPDVVHIEYDFLPSFINTDGLADMAQYGANVAKPYFVPWTWGQVSPDGKSVFGIPWDNGPMALIYNKKIFDQYGLTVPSTWDEFAQQA